MARNKTANYGLSQWVATDQVVRGDFNSDNAKLDAAIKGAEAKADNAQETADSAKSLAEAAYCPDNLPFVVGTYTGNGAASRTISLGFTPRAVLVVREDGNMYQAYTGSSEYSGGLAITGQNATCYYGDVVNIVDGGFQIHYLKSEYGTITSNTKDTVFLYLALK